MGIEFPSSDKSLSRRQQAERCTVTDLGRPHLLASTLLWCVVMSVLPVSEHPENENKRREGAPTMADFEREIIPHRNELYGAAFRYTKNARDAEDLVQETMLRALAAWQRFIPGSNARAWLHRILTNNFINSYRQRKNRRRFATETGEDAAVALHGEDVERSADPRRQLFKNELGDEVTSALNSLGHDYRQVVVLADLQGTHYQEIAKTLDVPVGTVMSRLFRARRKLERALRGYAASDYGIRKAA